MMNTISLRSEHRFIESLEVLALNSIGFPLEKHLFIRKLMISLFYLPLPLSEVAMIDLLLLRNSIGNIKALKAY